MKKIKTFRLSIAVFLIISLIIQPNLITYGAQVQVEPDKSSVSANISNPETTEENASGPVVDITHIPQVSPKVEISAEPAEDQPEEPSEQTTVPVADPIKMMEENKTAVPGSENTPEPEAQLTSIPSAMPKEDEKNPVSEDKASSGSNTDNDEEKETKEETIKVKLGDIKSGLFGMLGISPDGAGDTTWQKDFTYVLDGEDIILSKYNGNASFLDIPAKAVIDGREYNSKFHSNCSGFFKDKKSLLEIDLSKVDSSNVASMNSMFMGCASLIKVNFDGFDTGKVTDMGYMFYGCSSLESPDVGGFKTANVTNMGFMFDRCSSLTSLDLSNFDTGNVTSMRAMFEKCNGLTSLDISSFDTCNVGDMGFMFYNCSGLTSLDVSNFDTAKATIMGYMFYNCSGLTSLDVSVFDTADVVTMGYMFYGCNGLTGLDLSNFDTASVTDMGYMFCYCKSLTELDLSGFNTASVKDMGTMFFECSSLKSLDLSHFDTGNLQITRYMFYDCGSLTSLDLSTFDMNRITNADNMFDLTSELTQIEVPRYVQLNIALPATFVKKTNPSDSYTALPKDVTKSFTIIKEGSHIFVTGITLEPTEKTIKEGEEFTIKPIVKPDDASDKTVKRTTSSKKTATVDENGKVTGVSAGQATITATTNDGGFTAECDVTVNNKKTGVTGVTVDPSERTIKADEEFVITATVEPENADDKRVIWTSSAPETATVDENGKVKGIAAGEATITATTVDGGYTAECVVTVTGSKIDVTGITVDPTARTIEENEEFVIIATIIPDNATDKGVTFTSSDPEVAAVDEDGKVTGISEGEAMITATTNDGNKKARCKVTVLKRKKDVTGITVEPASKTINTDEEFIISATVIPDDATDKSVTWTSSDTDIAEVDNDGKVTGKAPGTVTITATTNDGEFTAGCTVTVIEDEEERVILNKYDISLYEGDRDQIIATVKPDSVADKSITWSSSDTAVATVDEHGWVEAVKAGVAVITATSKNGKTADCIVTVISRTVPVESITADPVSKTIFIGESFFITTTITPEDATDKGVTWSSDDPVIASVYRGSVTGYSVGTTTVRVRSNDGGKEASCIVTVKERPVEVKSIILDPTEDQIFINETLPISAKVLPENAVDKTLKWTTNNPSVATVDNNGNVRGIGLGEAVITARASNGVNAVCIIKVIDLPPRVKEIYVNPIVKTIYKGEAFTIVATVLPKDAGVTDVLWKSDKPDIATVDDKGRVFGKKAGEAIITATTVDGGFTAECKVTVIERPAPVPPVSYKLYIVDQRTKDALSRHMVRGSVERLPADRYLILRDSDGSSIKPLINGDSALDHNRAVYYDLSLRDAAGNKVNDFGKCTIRIPLIEDMDIHNGSVRVVSMVDDKLDRSISSSTGTEGDVSYVTFSTGHFTDFAILYKLNSSSDNHYNQNYYSSPYQYILAINTGMAVNNSMRVLDRVPRTGEYIQFYGKGKEKFTKKWYSYKAL